MAHKAKRLKNKKRLKNRRPPSLLQKQSNANTVKVNVNNKFILNRRRQNLREVRRALPGSKSLQGYSRYGIPELNSQSALLNSTMMSQFNNFRTEIENSRRDFQAEQNAFLQRAQQNQNVAAAFGGGANVGLGGAGAGAGAGAGNAGAGAGLPALARPPPNPSPGARPGLNQPDPFAAQNQIANPFQPGSGQMQRTPQQRLFAQ